MRLIKSQSAMEYLMTYGWSILIIAIVLGAMFQLGVFSSQNFAPKAQPGSCKVVKLGSPGTTTSTNLQGVCNLRPQYVAQFNGASSSIGVGSTTFPAGSSPVSVFAWVYLYSSGTTRTVFDYGTRNVQPEEATLYYQGSSGTIRFWDGANSYSGLGILTTGAWHFVGYSYAGGTSITVYMDGSSAISTIPQQNVVLTSTGYIGQILTGGQTWNGLISDVQLYNTSLDASQIQALYQEGIGGAQTSLQNLVGWWPLNGNANDYSGNGNNGVPTSVLFTSAYTYP